MSREASKAPSQFESIFSNIECTPAVKKSESGQALHCNSCKQDKPDGTVPLFCGDADLLATLNTPAYSEPVLYGTNLVMRDFRHHTKLSIANLWNLEQ